MNVMFAGFFGGWEIVLILAVVLILFGAKKLPELARGMGRAIKEFGAARDEIEKGISQSGPSGVTQVKLLDPKNQRLSPE